MKCFQSYASVSLSVHGERGGGPHVTITHDAFDLTVQVSSWPNPLGHGTWVPPHASDIWWQPMESQVTCSNLFTWGPPPTNTHIWWLDHRNTYSWQAGGIHPTGMLYYWLHVITARKRSLGQGNMFTGMCLSTGEGGCLVRGVWSQGGASSGGVPAPGGAWWRANPPPPPTATAEGSTHPCYSIYLQESELLDLCANMFEDKVDENSKKCTWFE